MIGPSLGDAQSFYSSADLSATDDHGHGTSVGALAAFGDLHQRIPQGLSCDVVLLSGRVLDTRAEYFAGIGIDLRYDTKIIANDIAAAVSHFSDTYDCRVFCLSFGDKRHPYQGGHLDGLALALDEMARARNILFVVSAGNVAIEDIPRDLSAYPEFLFRNECRVIDPASALNVLTVGSVARREATDWQNRYQRDANHVPIAKVNEPAPFTRTGPTVSNSVKPDVVFYGGNVALNITADHAPVTTGLGELSAHAGYLNGRVLGEMIGTSASAPVVAHLAARVLASTPFRDPMLARAIIAAHSRVPRASRRLFRDDQDKIANVLGYGIPDLVAPLRSSNKVATLYARDAIANKLNHFYEIPIPAEFFQGNVRSRSLSVALSYFASGRSSRIEYKEQRLSFKLVDGTLDQVARMFDAATSKDDYQNIPEVAFANSISARRRSRGTLQSCTWTLKKPRKLASNLVLVVTRNDRDWARESGDEAYALAIVLDDRLNANATLFAHAQQRLRLQVQA